MAALSSHRAYFPNSPLPTSVSLYPMASEVYKEELAEAEALLRLIARFDLLLSGKVVEQ